MCMDIDGPSGFLSIRWLAILFTGVAVFASGSLARASGSRRFALWSGFSFAVLLVRALPLLQSLTCASDIVLFVLSLLLPAAVVAVAAVSGMALVIRARHTIVTPAVRIRVVTGSIGGIAAAFGVAHMIARLIQE